MVLIWRRYLHVQKFPRYHWHRGVNDSTKFSIIFPVFLFTKFLTNCFLLLSVYVCYILVCDLHLLVNNFIWSNNKNKQKLYAQTKTKGSKMTMAKKFVLCLLHVGWMEGESYFLRQVRNHKSAKLSVYLTICLSVHLSVFLTICLSFYLSICGNGNYKSC